MSDTDTPPFDVRIDEGGKRFVTQVGELEAFIDYRLEDAVLTLTHTEVPKEFTGQGIAGNLVRWVLDHAREQGYQVMPRCPFVKAYIRRHPTYADLVHPAFGRPR